MRRAARTGPFAALAALALLAACTSPGGPTPSPTPTATPSPTDTPTPDPLAGWTLEEKVGQIVMVGLDLTSPQAVSTDVVRDRDVAGLFLHGRSDAGVDAVRSVVDAATAQAPPGRRVLVAVDQEGGEVQSLSGPGFDDIPSALEQGSLDPADLRARAATWGAQLAAAGVAVDLAPVTDVVPAGTADRNPPIGGYDRQYGSTADAVAAHAGAFAEGLADAGVLATSKHFPGLGAVTADTDTTADVRDTVTGRDSEQVAAFGALVDDGVPLVMVSSAVYTLLDPDRPAVFSPEVVDGLLRDDLGFRGVVSTDDLSAASQVLAWSPGDRAVLAVEAGCDLVLASKDPTVAPAMLDALLDRAREDPQFAARVEDAARRVLALSGGA